MAHVGPGFDLNNEFYIKLPYVCGSEYGHGLVNRASCFKVGIVKCHGFNPHCSQEPPC